MKSIRVLQIGADRSQRGILFPHTQAAKRQQAYATLFGAIDIIAFSRKSDGAVPYILDELRVYPTNSPSRFLYGWDAWHILRSIPKPDIISVQDPFETGLLGLLFATIVQAPLHVQVHADFLAREYARHSILNRLRVRIAGFVLRRAARIRVVSARLEKGIQERYAPKAPVTLLPMFVPVEIFNDTIVPPELSEKFSTYAQRLLFVGRFEPEKNPSLAIHSFAHSAPKSACLIMVGDGSERAVLEQLARELHVADRVFFEGLRDAAPYYKVVDLVLVTSDYEGYGVVIVEALASGTPVLATDVGVAGEMGAIVADRGSFSDALKKWFTDKPHRASLKPGAVLSRDEHMKIFKDDIVRAIGNTEISA